MGDEGAPTSLRRSLLRLATATVAIVVIGLVAGYAFGRTDARRAAALLVDDFVADEPIGTATEGTAPSSGAVTGEPIDCGVVTEPLDPARQIAALRAGVVIVQHRGADVGAQVEAWAAERHGVLSAPNPDLDDAVVATAWGRRMRLTTPNVQLLTAFVTAFGDAGPDDRACGL